MLEKIWPFLGALIAKDLTQTDLKPKLAFGVVLC